MNLVLDGEDYNFLNFFEGMFCNSKIILIILNSDGLKKS